MPCFNIIEDPLNKKKNGNDKGSFLSREKNTEVTSKILMMSPMNLMWNITNAGLHSLRKKFPKSEALNIVKYKGGANEKLNAVRSPKKETKIFE